MHGASGKRAIRAHYPATQHTAQMDPAKWCGRAKHHEIMCKHSRTSSVVFLFIDLKVAPPGGTRESSTDSVELLLKCCVHELPAYGYRGYGATGIYQYQLYGSISDLAHLRRSRIPPMKDEGESEFTGGVF